MSFPRAAAALSLVMALATGGHALGQSEGSGGSAPGEQQVLRFNAALNTTLNHRESVSLGRDGRSGQSGRAMLGLTWSLSSRRTQLFASLNPYYERFFQEGGFSSYGGSAGLGMSRRVTPNYNWNLTGTVTAAPDQDIPPAATSEDPALPTAQVLVPRNGFVSGALQFGNGITLSPQATLDVALNASIARFSVYDAGDEEAAPGTGLVDNRSVGLSVGTSFQTSDRNTWSASLAANQYSLDDGGAAGAQDSRGQASLSGSYQRALSQRASLSIGSGLSSIETGGGGSSASTTPTLSAAYSLSGERMSTSFSLGRSQGIFPASGESVDSTSLAASLALNPWQRASMSFSAGYSLARGADSSGGEDSRTRSFNASYRLARRLLGWSLAVHHARQSSDAAFSRSLEFTSFATSLIWRIAGRGGRR